MSDGNEISDGARILVVEGSDPRVAGYGALFGDRPVLVIEAGASREEALRLLAREVAVRECAGIVHVLPSHGEISALAARLADEEALATLRREGVEAILHDGVIIVAEGLADRIAIESRMRVAVCAEGVESLSAAMVRVMTRKVGYQEVPANGEKGFYRQFERKRRDGSYKRGRR